MPSDDGLIDSVAEEIGFPPNISELLQRIISDRAEVILSDSQIGLSVNMKSVGLHHLFKNLIRCVATGEKHDEFFMF